jgi:hypothetical protein
MNTYACIFVLGVSVGMWLDQLLDWIIRRLDRISHQPCAAPNTRVEPGAATPAREG